MRKGSMTRFKLDPKKPPKSDWRDFDAGAPSSRAFRLGCSAGD
jgi:hypothetical protein